MNGIFWTLLVLWRKSVYQQGRRKDASELAWAQFKYKAAQVSCDASDLCSDRDTKRILAELRRAAKRSSRGTEECIQSLLDFVATPLEERDVAANDEVSKSVAEILEHYEKARPSTLLGRQNELRALCMLVEGKIAGSPGERFDACLPDVRPQRPLPDRRRPRGELLDMRTAIRNTWLERIDHALDLCRLLNPEGARDSSHDPYYLRFRSRLLLAKARLQWLGAKDLEPSRQLEPFRQADWLLESARASISADDHARLARLEMTWAEGLLLQANLSLNGACPDQAQRDRALAAARVSYQRAGDALQRARDQLTRSSRDVESWASFQRIWAQYQAEWCLFHLARLESELRVLENDSPYKRKRELGEHTPRDMAALLKRLKRGLNGLQAGLVIQPEGSNDRRLSRIWLELLCAGMVYGVTTAAGSYHYERLLGNSSQKWPLGINSFWEHWKSLNERAGIPSTVEAAGRYCDLLSVAIEDPQPGSATWRENMVKQLRDRSDRVSTLRDEALAMVDELYICKKNRFAATLTRRVKQLVAPIEN